MTPDEQLRQRLRQRFQDHEVEPAPELEQTILSKAQSSISWWQTLSGQVGLAIGGVLVGGAAWLLWPTAEQAPVASVEASRTATNSATRVIQPTRSPHPPTRLHPIDSTTRLTKRPLTEEGGPKHDGDSAQLVPADVALRARSSNPQTASSSAGGQDQTIPTARNDGSLVSRLVTPSGRQAEASTVKVSRPENRPGSHRAESVQKRTSRLRRLRGLPPDRTTPNEEVRPLNAFGIEKTPQRVVPTGPTQRLAAPDQSAVTPEEGVATRLVIPVQPLTIRAFTAQRPWALSVPVVANGLKTTDNPAQSAKRSIHRFQWSVGLGPALTYQVARPLATSESATLLPLTYPALAEQRLGGQLFVQTSYTVTKRWAISGAMGYGVTPQWARYQEPTGTYQVTYRDSSLVPVSIIPEVRSVDRRYLIQWLGGRIEGWWSLTKREAKSTHFLHGGLEGQWSLSARQPSLLLTVGYSQSFSVGHSTLFVEPVFRYALTSTGYPPLAIRSHQAGVHMRMMLPR